MSRSSNRGPRADIALLRKLKADPNFSPASLLNSGPNILEKANKLKGFVAEQRGKLGASSAKTEWLLAYQHLQGEQDDAERELASYLQQFADQHQQSGELREVAEAVYTLQSQSEACRAERMRLRSRIKGFSSVHASYKAHGAPAQTSREAGVVKGQMSSTAGELQAGLVEVAEQVQVLTGQLRAAWPSALAGPGEGLAAAGGGGGGSVGAPGYNRAEDLEELDGMMERYPLASADIKDRIREVFNALQDKYLERLETWRVEADQAARELRPGPSGSSGAAFASTTHLPSRRSYQTSSTSQQSGHPGGVGGRAGGRGLRGPAGAAVGTAGGTAPGAGAGRGQGLAATSSPGGGSPGPPTVAGGRDAVRSVPPLVVSSGAAGSKQKTAEHGAGPLMDDAVEVGGGGGGVYEDAVDGGGLGAGGGYPESPGADGALFSPSGAGGVGWVFGGYGGWTAEEHSAFVRHRDRLMKEAGQGTKAASREVLMARIATLLPGGRTVAEVAAHDDWTTAARLLGRKRRDLAEGWEREMRQFLEDSSNFLQESETTFFVQAEEAAERLIAELVRVKARDELEELRAERARDEEVAAAERAVAEAAEAEARVLAEARERQQRAVQKDMIAAYRAELERQHAEAEAAAAEAQHQADLVAEQQAVYNRERVGVRQAEYLERLEQAKERQEAAETEAAARAARLDRLRALVAPLVEADPARVLAPTAASAAVADKADGAFNPVNGYTTDQVVKDQRFKMMEALAAVGLQQTDYARKVIAAARPAQPTRPDNFTSEQREAMKGR